MIPSACLVEYLSARWYPDSIIVLCSPAVGMHEAALWREEANAEQMSLLG